MAGPYLLWKEGVIGASEPLAQSTQFEDSTAVAYPGALVLLAPNTLYRSNGTTFEVVTGEKVTAEFADDTNGVAVVEQGQFDYETVATSQTDQVLGNTGGVGDFLHRVVCVVTTSGANGVVSIKDGSGSAISIVPASAPVGVHNVELNIVSTSGAWKVTTGSAATAIGIGRFTA